MNFLPFKIVISDIYPKQIRDLSEKIGVPVEEIAKSKGIRPGQIVYEFKRRDIVEMIDTITQHPDNTKYCILNYVDGSFDVVAETVNQVQRKIEEFLGENLIYHHRNVMYFTQLEQNHEHETDEED